MIDESAVSVRWMMRWLFRNSRGVIIPLFILASIEIVVLAGVVNPLIVPRPSEVLGVGAGILRSSEIWIDVGATLRRVVEGFGLALIVAVPVGIAVGAVEKVERSAGLTIDFLRSLPATALIPAFLILFGVGEMNKVAMVGFVVSLILIIQIREGLRGVPRSAMEVASIFGLGRWARALITMRFSLPSFFSGVVVSINLALVMVVVVEMFVGGGTRSGLGQRIYEAQSGFRMKEMWAAIGLVGIMGYLLAALARLAGRWFAPWGGVGGNE